MCRAAEASVDFWLVILGQDRLKEPSAVGAAAVLVMLVFSHLIHTPSLTMMMTAASTARVAATGYKKSNSSRSSRRGNRRHRRSSTRGIAVEATEAATTQLAS